MIKSNYASFPFMLFFFYPVTIGVLQEGDECTLTQTAGIGICTKFFDCSYTSDLLISNEKPEYCQQITNLLCCPQRKSEIECLNYRKQEEGSKTTVFGVQKPLAKEFPHMAALGFGDKANIAWACGGSLISEEFVLTAAHCTRHKDLGAVRWVRLGDLDIKSTTDDAKPQDFTVSQIIVHPQYKAPSHYHDIALIKLDRRAKFDDYVRPACLHTKKLIPKRLTVTGWGKVQFLGTTSSHLLKADLDLIDYNTCKARYETVSKRKLSRGIVDEMQLCAGDPDGKDACPGDSGGPLQVKVEGSPSYYRIVGITSFGKACGFEDSAGVYVRVSNYLRWIEDHVWSDYLVWS